MWGLGSVEGEKKGDIVPGVLGPLTEYWQHINGTKKLSSYLIYLHCLTICLIACGPSVSYNGTMTIENALQACSMIDHSIRFCENIPINILDSAPFAMRPDPVR